MTTRGPLQLKFFYNSTHFICLLHLSVWFLMLTIPVFYFFFVFCLMTHPWVRSNTYFCGLPEIFLWLRRACALHRSRHLFHLVIFSPSLYLGDTHLFWNWSYYLLPMQLSDPHTSVGPHQPISSAHWGLRRLLTPPSRLLTLQSRLLNIYRWMI